MKVTKKGAQSTIKPYLFEEDEMVFLREDMAEQAMNAIMERYENVYCGIEDGAAGSKKLVVKSINKTRKTIFAEIYIRQQK